MTFDAYATFNKTFNEKHDITVIAGFNQEEYLHTLQSEGWCIAQHGCTHIYNTHKKGCFPLNALSEYAGNSYENQYASLEKGQKILKEHEIHTDIFMAPAHSYDYNTLKALKKLGFTKIFSVKKQKNTAERFSTHFTDVNMTPIS